MTTNRTNHTRWRRIWVAVIIAVFVLLSVSMVATKLVYDSIFDRYDRPYTPPPDALTEMVARRETMEYDGGDNRLTGYLYTASQPRQALIVLAPGFHASVDDYLWQIKSLLEYGWSVFAFDTTGSCTSEGTSSVGFVQEVYDLEATLHYVEQHDRFGYTDVVLLGHSRGGYAACCALESSYDVAAVVSVSGVNSAMEAIMGSSVRYVGSLAYGNYGFLWLYQTMLFGASDVNLTAADAIADSDVPVLIVHGDGDETVPMERYSIISHRDEIPQETVEYIVCTQPQQNGHTDLLFDADGTANDALMAQIDAFLQKHVA